MGSAASAAVWFGKWVTRRNLASALWAALLCWAGAILWLSSMSPNELPDAAFVFWDKVNHFVAFTVGGWLAAGALRTSYPGIGSTRAVALAVVLVAAFGALDEGLQTLTPGRSGADLDDWIADVLGVCTGALLNLRTSALLRRSSR